VHKQFEQNYGTIIECSVTESKLIKKR